MLAVQELSSASRGGHPPCHVVPFIFQASVTWESVPAPNPPTAPCASRRSTLPTLQGSRGYTGPTKQRHHRRDFSSEPQVLGRRVRSPGGGEGILRILAQVCSGQPRWPSWPRAPSSTFRGSPGGNVIVRHQEARFISQLKESFLHSKPVIPTPHTQWLTHVPHFPGDTQLSLGAWSRAAAHPVIICVLSHQRHHHPSRTPITDYTIAS